MTSDQHSAERSIQVLVYRLCRDESYASILHVYEFSTAFERNPLLLKYMRFKKHNIASNFDRLVIMRAHISKNSYCALIDAISDIDASSKTEKNHQTFFSLAQQYRSYSCMCECNRITMSVSFFIFFFFSIVKKM